MIKWDNYIQNLTRTRISGIFIKNVPETCNQNRVAAKDSNTKLSSYISLSFDVSKHVYYAEKIISFVSCENL